MQISKAQSALQYFQRFGRAMLVLFGLAFFTAFFTSMHSRPASATAPGTPVTIANTPLPITGNVNATVNGTVGISGTPSVAISNTPTVSLSGTPTVNLGSGSGPLPVTAAGDPSLSGFTTVTGFGTSSFAGAENCIVNVPNTASYGQMLVIENVGALVWLPSGQKVIGMQIGGVGSNSYLTTWMPTYQADDGSQAFFGASQAMRFYIPAGSDMSMSASTEKNTTGGLCQLGYTGYLVNVH